MFFNMMGRIDKVSRDGDKCKERQIMLSTMDCIICILSSVFTMSILELNITTNSLIPVIIYCAINLVFLLKLGCYDSLWQCGGECEAVRIFIADVLTVIPAGLIIYAIGFERSIAFYVVNGLMIIVAMTFTRVAYRAMRRAVNEMRLNRYSSLSKVLIVGAGQAGNLIIKELFQNPKLKKIPVAVVDDDLGKIGKYVFNVPVKGTISEVERIVREENIDEIIIAIAKIDQERKTEIIELCKNTKCTVKIIPGLYEIIEGKVKISKIRKVRIEDILGREPIKISLSDMDRVIKDKVVMVTGGGGSIGSELCRQIVKYSPKQLVLVDIYENNAYDIQQELVREHGRNLNMKVLIASVRDEDKMEAIFKEYGPEVVFHAAAHKHVPLMEDSPCEAIKNNVFGTQNVANLSDKYGVKKFVLISTDKAVNPTNIMGATKRCCEMIVQLLDKKSKTEFVAVRFGNVLGSNGSVVPLFEKQIADGGPVTVTHEEVTRFFMTIPEAVSLVLQASAMAKGGEIFALDMGKPVKIIDLARKLIKLNDLEPGVDIDIVITGLRPGEKLYEEVLMDEEGLTRTDNDKIRIGKPIEIDEKEFNRELGILRKVAYSNHDEKVDLIMKSIVPTYVRQEKII